jgi:hypothetical protein
VKSPRAASRSKVLPLKDSPKKADDAESAKDKADIAAAAQKETDRKAADKISQVPALEGQNYALDQSLTQCFGMEVIKHFKGQVDKIPTWRFGRWYFGAKVVVDTFRTQSAYDAAGVEKRRELVHTFGGRYAALGPSHTRLPHADKGLRARFPSLVEQIAQVPAEMPRK